MAELEEAGESGKQGEDLCTRRLEGLAIAGYMAPRMRGADEAKRKRKVYRVKDGKVVGEATLEEVQKGLLKARELEFDVADGVRPREVSCKDCGKPAKVPATGPVPTRCKQCRIGYCAACGGRVAHRTSRVCAPCARKASYKGPALCPRCGKARKSKDGRGKRLCVACWKAGKKPRQTCAGCNVQLGRSAALHGNKMCRACVGVSRRRPGCSDCGGRRSCKSTTRCDPCARAHRKRVEAVAGRRRSKQAPPNNPQEVT